jgi:hypothetical protein
LDQAQQDKCPTERHTDDTGQHVAEQPTMTAFSLLIVILSSQGAYSTPIFTFNRSHM